MNSPAQLWFIFKMHSNEKRKKKRGDQFFFQISITGSIITWNSRG